MVSRYMKEGRGESLGERGVAMVQVLVMSVMLITLAAGVLKLIFGTHTMVARAKTGDKARYWAEACMAEKQAVWAGNPCNGAASDSCTFTKGAKTYTVNIDCSNKPEIKFTYNYVTNQDFK